MTRIWKWIQNWPASPIFWITIIWLTIGLALVIIYLFLFGKVNWQVLTGFATWVLAGGVFLAFWQIREARKSTNAQIAMDLFRELRSDKILDIIRYIYNLQPNEDGKCITEKHKHDIDYILNRLDILGILVDEGIVDKRIAIDGYAGVTALRCWYILHQYIWKLRCQRGYFGENTENFTRLCMDYFLKHNIEVNLYKEAENRTKPSKIPLITLLMLDSSIRPRNLKEIKRDRNKKSSKNQTPS
jgi:hypothetical protein